VPVGCCSVYETKRDSCRYRVKKGFAQGAYVKGSVDLQASPVEAIDAAYTPDCFDHNLGVVRRFMLADLVKGTSINARRYRLGITIRANKAKIEGNIGLLARFFNDHACVLTLKCAAMN
jgi:hypothetical protein